MLPTASQEDTKVVIRQTDSISAGSSFNFFLTIFFLVKGYKLSLLLRRDMRMNTQLRFFYVKLGKEMLNRRTIHKLGLAKEKVFITFWVSNFYHNYTQRMKNNFFLTSFRILEKIEMINASSI